MSQTNMNVERIRSTKGRMDASEKVDKSVKFKRRKARKAKLNVKEMSYAF